MKKWNKLLALGMAFSMTLALTACSGQSADTSGEAAEPQSAAPSTAASDSADASEAAADYWIWQKVFRCSPYPAKTCLC